MFKFIKKSFKYLAIMIGIIIIVPTFFYFAISIPEVQTFIIKRITSHFSEVIRSTITVGRLEYSFFNKLLIDDLLIKDKNNDTMIYCRHVTLGFRNLDFRNKIIRINRAELTDPTVALITDTTGLMNLNWYLGMLKNQEGGGKKDKSIFSINNVVLNNGRFILLDRNSRDDKISIDFNDLNLSLINGSVDDFRIKNDSIAFNITNLQFTESTGFKVNGLSSNVLIADNDLLFNNVYLNCDSSSIVADRIGILADSSGSYKNFLKEVRLDITLRKSQVSSTDLKHFVPFIKEYHESVNVSGSISGTVAELKGRNINLTYGDYSDLDCDFDLSGLPEFKDAFIYIGVNSLKTNTKDFTGISIPGKENLKIPEILNKLGNISFEGSFTGFVNDFVAYGKIATEKGDLMTDVSLRPYEKNRFKIKGLIKGVNIDLGELSGKSDKIGKLSMVTNLDGDASSVKKISGTLTGRIDSIEVNRYIYRNVMLSGIFTEKTWDGSIKVSDRNIKMDLLGMFDFSKELPEFNFTLNLAESKLFNLNFASVDSTAQLAALITANFKGNNIDNLLGEIKLLNSTIIRNSNKLELYNFSLKTFAENNKPAISLSTDFVDADLRGYYNFGEVSTVLRKVLSALMPSRFSAPQESKEQIKNNFYFVLNFENTEKINNFFKTGIFLADKSTIKGSFYPDSIIKVSLNSKRFTYKNNTFNDLAFDAHYSGTTLITDVRSSSLSLLGQTDLKDFKIGLNTIPDNFFFRFDWDNKEKEVNKGSFVARGSIFKKEEGKPGAVLKIGIDPSDVYVRNNLWKINKSDITIDSNAVNINNFTVSSRDNFYLIDGNITENPNDSLRLEFKGIDLSPLNNFDKKGSKSNDTGIPLNIKGIINGNILISNVLSNPLVESEIKVNGFSLLGGNYGDISLGSEWNASKKVADITAINNLNGVRNLDVSGFYDPATRRISLDAKTSRLPVDALNPLLSFFASEITGTVSGRVKLSGEINKPVLTGALFAENTSMRIDYLQTKYWINDSIRFDRSGIKFRNIKITDERGRTAVLSGSVDHKYFNDFAVDLSVNMNDCLVMNTQAKDNEMFYGTVYATGFTTIRSSSGLLSFDISGTTGRNTRFFIPMNSGLSVSEYSFVSFVNPDTLGYNDAIRIQMAQANSTGTNLELNVDLDVTPDAEVQLLIDPKAGDVIKGRGEGKLNINLNKAGDLKITGEYVIEEGDYLFTLGNIFNKRFDVESGGRITFNGDVENAEIDLKAVYKNLKTSLYPILQDERYNERIPVEPQLNLAGNLFNPFVRFDIYLPNADEETRAYLKNAITTEEELSRQFLFLLVMNSFYSDLSTGSSSGSTATGTSAMAATTTEMVSNQLSNWLSQISNDFNIGFRYRPGNKNMSTQEVEVALSTQLLNDKVLINGNFDVRGADNSYGTPITGDFDIEYKITEKIRFKVFNRYNNPYTGRGAPYTQGVGLFFKQDFNKFSDLIRMNHKSDIKKEDEITIK